VPTATPTVPVFGAFGPSTAMPYGWFGTCAVYSGDVLAPLARLCTKTSPPAEPIALALTTRWLSGVNATPMSVSPLPLSVRVGPGCQFTTE